MFTLAVKAGIPLVGAYTSDTVNLTRVIEELTGEKVVKVPKKMSEIGLTDHRVYWTTEQLPCDESLYSNLVSAGKTIILVNQPESHPLVFYTGAIPTPKTLIQQFLSEVIPEDEVPSLASSFSGLTLKDLGEVARLTMVRDGTLTPRGVLNTRAMLVSKTQGVQQIDTSLDVYLPYEPLEEWVKLNAPYFLSPPDPRLVPRGVLLNGNPGTGKSQAAKYIASEWNVPAYRLDMTDTLGRYVGESESRFQKVLGVMDSEGPAVLLLDEVEKLFSEASDQNVTSRLLSQLLWWLQEHTSRVFVVMTTNDMDAIPKELYRGRRIDKVFTVQKLDASQAHHLGLTILRSFKEHLTPTEVKVAKKTINEYLAGQEDARVAHAQVTQLMYDLVKKHQLWDI